MQPIYQKATDVDVIQRVLTYWSPLETGSFMDWLYGGGPLHEYDRYTPGVMELLRSGTFNQLWDYLNYIQYDLMNVERSPHNTADAKHICWCFHNVWETQQRPETNIRIQYPSQYTLAVGNQRSVNELEIIQLFLESIPDEYYLVPWLWGEDTLKGVDDTALKIWSDTRKTVEAKRILQIIQSSYLKVNPDYLEEDVEELAIRLKFMRSRGQVFRHEVGI